MHARVDGRDIMLNDREGAHWVATGDFKRITEADIEDAEYLALRDRMLANGDEAFYRRCCPPTEDTPPMLLGASRWQRCPPGQCGACDNLCDAHGRPVPR